MEDAFHCTGLPALFSRWSRNSIRCQLLCNSSRRQPLHESSIDSADNDRLLRYNFWKAVRSFAVTEELFIWQVDLPVGEAFSLPPGYILRNGAAFFLRQARHNGEQQFTLAVEGVNVLLFKVDLDAFLFEFADGDEAIHGVSSESADGLCNDEVDFSRQGILDHLIETRTVLGIRAGNPLICIDLYECPFLVSLNVLRVVVDLSFVAGELLIAVRGNTGVSSNSQFVKRRVS